MTFRRDSVDTSKAATAPEASSEPKAAAKRRGAYLHGAEPQSNGPQARDRSRDGTKLQLGPRHKEVGRFSDGQGLRLRWLPLQYTGPGVASG